MNETDKTIIALLRNILGGIPSTITVPYIGKTREYDSAVYSCRFMRLDYKPRNGWYHSEHSICACQDGVIIVVPVYNQKMGNLLHFKVLRPTLLERASYLTTNIRLIIDAMEKWDA